MTRPYEIFVATHVSDIYGPAQALRNDLVSQKKDFVFAACPFEYASVPAATVTCYRQGRVEAEYTGHAHARHAGPGLWLQDARFVMHWARRLCGPQTLFVGVNNLNAAAGIWARRLGWCGAVVYYVIDYTPRRFSSRLLNACYQAVCRFAARRADAVWNLSERMREVHARFGTRKERNLLVPVGVETQQVKMAPEAEIVRNRLVIVSALFENKGVQLAIRAMRSLPQACLEVVGVGPYASALQQLAQELGVAERVKFLGLMNHEQLFAYLPFCRAALATYVPDPANYTYYADPTKPKEYLACGVPVVITRVPWIAEVIDQRPMGAAVAYDEQQAAAACGRLLDDEAFWKQCRQNALAYAKEIDWSAIYAQAWDQTFAVVKQRENS